MTPAPPLSRSLPARIAAFAATILLLMGCSPEPDPGPSPTPAFASEEEAFAAAEETYRAYADASNSTNLQDQQSFEPVYVWLRGDALSGARKNYARFYAEGMTRTGVTTFDTFTAVAYEGETVTAHLCLDVSGVALFDAKGASVVPTDRPSRQSLEVQFTSADTSSSLAITSAVSTTELEC